MKRKIIRELINEKQNFKTNSFTLNLKFLVPLQALTTYELFAFWVFATKMSFMIYWEINGSITFYLYNRNYEIKKK